MLFRSILAVGAHPDDVVLGVAASLARFTASGARVTILTLTSGELRGDPLQREREEREAAHELDAAVSFARLPDGALVQRDAIAAVARVVAETCPDLLLAPDPSDEHQDHVAAARACFVAARAVRHFFVYEGPSTAAFSPSIAVDVGSTWSRKRKALAAHRSQHDDGFLVRWATATARYRALRREPSLVCEALRVVKSDAVMFGLPDEPPASGLARGAEFARR